MPDGTIYNYKAKVAIAEFLKFKIIAAYRTELMKDLQP